MLGVLLVARYAWFFDDSFIYFRYVDNLLFLDAGLTFNAGEFVEGYSSPLHVLILILLRSLKLSYPSIVLILGTASFVAFWYLLVASNREWSPDITGKNALNLPLAYLTLNYSVASFFTSGNETALVHVVAAASALLVLRPESRILAVIVAVGPLARPELALSLGLMLFWVGWRTGRFPWWLFLVSTAANLAWLLFRIDYYADLLPNTFYLKHSTTLLSGSNLEFGVRYLLDVVRTYHLGLVAACCAGSAALLWARAAGEAPAKIASLRLVERVVMLGLALSVGAYVVRSGGSAMHYYYLAFSFVLAACALGGVLEQVAEELRPDLRPGLRLAGMLALSLVFFGWYPAVLSAHPVSGRARMTQRPSPTVITDPTFFRTRESGHVPPWPRIADMQAFAEVLRRDGYDDVGIDVWCDATYASFRVRYVHAYGLTDAVLARIDTPEQKRGHKPLLVQLASQLVALQNAPGPIGAGAFGRAVAEGRAPTWVEDNLAAIGLIERRVFNRHDFFENLEIALSFPGKIRLPVDARREPSPRG